MNDAADFQDVRWRRLIELHAAGELENARDLEFLREHVPDDADALAEREVLDALEHWTETWDDHGDAWAEAHDDEATIEAVLARLPSLAHAPKTAVSTQEDPVAAIPQPRLRSADGSQTEDLIEPDESQMRGRGWRFALGLGGLAAAASFVAVALGVASPVPPAVPVFGAQARIWNDAPPIVSPDDAPGPTPMTIASGELAPSPTDRGMFRVETPRACLQSRDALACFSRDTTVRIDEHGLEIVSGEGEIELHTQSYAIMVAGAMYTALGENGAHLAVHVVGGRRWDVRTRGAVTVLHADGRRETTQANRRFASKTNRKGGASQQPSAPVSTADRLAEARRLRARGLRKPALAVYEELVRQHPDDPHTGAALIAAAELHAQLGRPRKALRHYDAYLARGGALEEEASLGRIEALRALGREEAVQVASRAFRRTYPSSRYKDRLVP